MVGYWEAGADVVLHVGEVLRRWANEREPFGPEEASNVSAVPQATVV